MPLLKILRTVGCIVWMAFLMVSFVQAGDLRPPAIPTLSSAEKTWTTGGVSPDEPENMEGMNDSPAHTQGQVRGDEEGMRPKKERPGGRMGCRIPSGMSARGLSRAETTALNGPSTAQENTGLYTGTRETSRRQTFQWLTGVRQFSPLEQSW